ncbi:hypothetical protein [Flavihumibacter solisilvae]|uniref:MoxR-vWA-beta-propeller ternary system domain-containing protein n=1 Tax=Flavihumibacter solisilvae TaxID=1349421 RepID=A0A0C1LAR6_9BACT|nr:hypothetical protein [Flavihumibacter solisilvae]KIC92613.1 hypothetical protein OI18_21760 [Flavihumibacter solisilvae]
MATDPAGSSGFLIELAADHRSYVFPVRHWDNLLLGEKDDRCYISGLTADQVNSVEIRSIPFTRIFEVRDGWLCNPGGLVPQSKYPDITSWNRLHEVLRVEKPSMNHNYFGMGAKLKYQLVPSAEEQEAVASLVHLDKLQHYIHTAPAVRLRHLQWLILKMTETFALVVGTPLLPLPGKAFWLYKNMLLPTGFKPAYPALTDWLVETLEITDEEILLWPDTDSLLRLEKENFRQLSISSYRQTISA